MTYEQEQNVYKVKNISKANTPIVCYTKQYS